MRLFTTFPRSSNFCFSFLYKCFSRFDSSSDPSTCILIFSHAASRMTPAKIEIKKYFSLGKLERNSRRKLNMREARKSFYDLEELTLLHWNFEFRNRWKLLWENFLFFFFHEMWKWKWNSTKDHHLISKVVKWKKRFCQVFIKSVILNFYAPSHTVHNFWFEKNLVENFENANNELLSLKINCAKFHFTLIGSNSIARPNKDHWKMERKKSTIHHN